MWLGAGRGVRVAEITATLAVSGKGPAEPGSDPVPTLSISRLEQRGNDLDLCVWQSQLEPPSLL